MPAIKAAEFSAVWREWWDILQPSWRLNSFDQNCPTDADWQVLQCGGNNGIFIVIMCLSWWGKAITSPQDNDAFQAAVDEVVWVLEKVSTFISGGSKRKANDISITSPNKRMRQ